MERVSSLKTPFFTILFIFLGLFLYSKLVGPIPFSVNSVSTMKQDTFTVTGEGKAAAAPDRAQISVGVTSTVGPNVKDIQSQVNATINTIVKELKALGIEDKDIRTANYNISPNYDFNAGQQITGYTVSANLSIDAPIEKANDVIDTATRNGANLVGGVQFTFSDEVKMKLEQEARKEAVDEAKKKAQGLADAAGIRLGRIINVQESSGFGIRPLPMLQRVGGPEDVKTSIEPGESAISISVTLSYETL